MVQKYTTGVLTKTGVQRYPSTSRLLIFCFDVVNRNANLVDTLTYEYESIDQEKKFSEIFVFKKLHVTESKKYSDFTSLCPKIRYQNTRYLTC